MELKRPFTEEDWEATPKPVRQYIIQLENIVIKLLKETEDLKKRVFDLENKLNKNSQNSSKPPFSDPPYKKPLKKRDKNKRKRGGQMGHKGHQQKLMEPSTENILFPDICSCGCSSFDPENIKPFYTHQVIDRASEALKPVHDKIGNIARNSRFNHIDETSWFQNGSLNWLWVMVNSTVAYFMIHKNRSKQAFKDLIQDWEGILVSDNYGVYAKWVNLRQTCLAYLIRKAKALSERKDPTTSLFDEMVTKDLQLFCHWANVFPDDQEWRDFYQRFTDLIFDHQEHKGEIGTLARSLIRQIEKKNFLIS